MFSDFQDMFPALQKLRERLPLVPISNLTLNDRQDELSSSHPNYGQYSVSSSRFSSNIFAKNSTNRYDPGGAAATCYKPSRLMPPKPSLDDIQDNSIVALTNKFGKGKYWFKSACPMPDPRWGAAHQLMIGPIPGDVEYSQLRAAFLSQGHTLHLFIQNNQVACFIFLAVFWIHDILVWIRIRGSMPLNNGSGSECGSGSF